MSEANQLGDTQAANAQTLDPQAQAANQVPAENPLDQLRDIHLPDAVDQFP